MNLPRFSIIIPVYNTPKEYLERCLSTLYRQEDQNWECVFVDNGSNLDYSDLFTDSRVRYTRLDNNQGIFLARRYGVLNANGEYIVFCDSDDWIDPALFQHIISAYQEDIDVYITKTTSVFQSGHKEFSYWANTGLKMAEEFGLFEALVSRKMVPWSIWGRVIKKSLLLKVYEGIANDYPICMGEDFLLTICYSYHVKKVKYLPVNGYFHVLNTQSTSLSISEIEKLERHLGDMNALIPLLDRYFSFYNIELDSLIPLKKDLLASFLIDAPKFSQNNRLYTDILPKLVTVFGEELVYGAFIESYSVRADALHWNVSKLFRKLFPQQSLQYRMLRSFIMFIWRTKYQN